MDEWREDVRPAFDQFREAERLLSDSRKELRWVLRRFFDQEVKINPGAVFDLSDELGIRPMMLYKLAGRKFPRKQGRR